MFSTEFAQVKFAHVIFPSCMEDAERQSKTMTQKVDRIWRIKKNIHWMNVQDGFSILCFFIFVALFSDCLIWMNELEEGSGKTMEKGTFSCVMLTMTLNRLFYMFIINANIAKKGKKKELKMNKHYIRRITYTKTYITQASVSTLSHVMAIYELNTKQSIIAQPNLHTYNIYIEKVSVLAIQSQIQTSSPHKISRSVYFTDNFPVFKLFYYGLSHFFRANKMRTATTCVLM